ncbi:hypothetical protein PJL18_03998 [Paenarthrobacter nicotinovorans]|nr:hypothetical protein [Paenarthrobacter nicotinovorans]
MLLSAGKPANSLEGTVRHANAVQAVQGFLLDFGGEQQRSEGTHCGNACQGSGADVIQGRAARNQVDLLKDHGHPLPRLQEFAALETVQCRAVNADASGIGSGDAHDATQRGGLARAVGAEEGNQFTGGDGEVDTLKDGPAVEGLTQPLDGERHYRSFSVRCMVLASSNRGV